MNENYKLYSFPDSRISTFDVGRVSLYKHHIAGLIEADVTAALNKISELKKSSEPVSFNAWLIKCIGDIAGKYPLLHGVKKGKRKVVGFIDADITIVVEKIIDSKPVPIPYIIRKVNNKSVSEIHNEIKSVKDFKIQDEGNYVLGGGYNRFVMKFYYMLPGFVRRFIWRIMISSPLIVKKTMGTIVFTNVGTAGKINGWFIPRSLNPLCIAVSSIVKKPGVVDNQILIRDFIHFTILIDHDVIDGAPAVRIINELVMNIESGCFL